MGEIFLSHISRLSLPSCVNEGPVSGGVALRPRPIEGQPCLLVSNIWNIFFSSGGDISLAYITP